MWESWGSQGGGLGRDSHQLHPAQGQLPCWGLVSSHCRASPLQPFRPGLLCGHMYLGFLAVEQQLLCLLHSPRLPGKSPGAVPLPPVPSCLAQACCCLLRAPSLHANLHPHLWVGAPALLLVLVCVCEILVPSFPWVSIQNQTKGIWATGIYSPAALEAGNASIKAWPELVPPEFSPWL